MTDRSPETPASWADAMCVVMYTARFADREAATHAAELILRHPGWRNFGGDEIAVIPSNIDHEDGLWWLCDLSEVPEARAHASEIVHAE